MRLLRLILQIFAGTFLLCMLTKSYAQAPNISYTPSTNVYTLGTAIPTLSPANTGGAVASFAYGTGAGLTGAALSNPYGMGIDPSGNIYVTNYGNNTISKYNSSGTYVGTFGNTAIANPQGITFDNSGNAYVLNYNRTNNGLGNHHGNAYVAQYSSTGIYGSNVIEGLGTANGIAKDASNNLYVAQGSYNGGNQTVSEYNSAGTLAFSLASGTITNPVGTAVDGSGNIYVLDNTNNNVVKFNSTGTYISTPITGLTNALGISIDGAGDIYIGDSGSNTVKVYDPSGALLTTISGLTDPEGLVTDSKGKLYISDYTNNTVTGFGPVGGYFLSGTLPPGLSFSSTTGTFSGTPTAPFAATTYTITAYNASGSSSTTVTLSCPVVASAPTISYNPSINVFTTNTPVSLSPTTTGNPTSFSISPALPTNTLTLNPSTGTFGGTPTVTSAAALYTVTATNASGSASTVVSLAFVKDDYWTGSKNSDWNTKQNWSANVVPTALNLASIGVIDYTGSEPSIPVGTVNAYYVTFGAAHRATLTVPTGATLNINNILTINKDATPIFTGTGTGTINILPAAVVNVTGTGALTIQSPLTFTLQSNATGSAAVSQMTTGSITGTVSVQRYISAHRAYRLISSPVYTSSVTSGSNTFNDYSLNYVKNSAYITGTKLAAGGFDVNLSPATLSENPTLYLYRENLAPLYTTFLNSNFRGVNDITQSPNYFLDTDGGPYNIPAGNGFLFFFRGDRASASFATETVTTWPATAATLTAKGTLNQGPITVTNWYTPGSANLGYTSGSVSVQGSNLVGNPYPSAIDWDQYVTGGITQTNVSPFSYQLIPTGAQGSGNYNVYQAGSTSKAGTQGTANSNIIASGQGFFVFATGAGASLTFTEAAKTNTQNTGTNLYMGKPVVAAVDQHLRLQLVMDTINSDGTIIRFSSNTSAVYNAKEDALYRVGTGKVSLASLSSDKMPLAINQLDLSKGQNIRLKLNASADGAYSLNMKEITGIPQLFDIWLMDAYAKDSVNMRQTATYSFNILKSDTNSYGTTRFTMVIRQNPALAYKLLDFTADKANNKVQLVWKTLNEENYTHFTVEHSVDNGKNFEVLGSLLSSDQGTYSLMDNAPVNGANLYRLRQEDYNGTITYSAIVKVEYANASNNLTGTGINIYPNPALSKITLTINPKIPVKAFNIVITNSTGFIVRQVTTTQTNWEENVTNLLTGTYLVQVVNSKDNSIIGQTKFVKL